MRDDDGGDDGVMAAPRRVVILGSTGFVGRAIATQVAERDLPVLGLGSAQLDLCDPASVEALKQRLEPDDAVVFCSAITPDKGKDAATWMKNIAMGHHVSAALGASACSQVIYISSDAVYDDAANPVRETSSVNPSSFHGLMHLARERLLQWALERAKIPLLILRPCALYGADDTHNSYGPNRFVRSALAEGRIALFGEGEEQRDHVTIEDVCRGVQLALARGSHGALTIGSGESVSFGQLAQRIRELSPTPVEIRGTPRASAVTHRHVDITALRKAFPEFRPTAWRDGIAALYTQLAGAGSGAALTAR